MTIAQIARDAEAHLRDHPMTAGMEPVVVADIATGDIGFCATINGRRLSIQYRRSDSHGMLDSAQGVVMLALESVGLTRNQHAGRDGMDPAGWAPWESARHAAEEPGMLRRRG